MKNGHQNGIDFKMNSGGGSLDPPPMRRGCNPLLIHTLPLLAAGAARFKPSALSAPPLGPA